MLEVLNRRVNPPPVCVSLSVSAWLESRSGSVNNRALRPFGLIKALICSVFQSVNKCKEKKKEANVIDAGRFVRGK